MEKKVSPQKGGKDDLMRKEKRSEIIKSPTEKKRSNKYQEEESIEIIGNKMIIHKRSK